MFAASPPDGALALAIKVVISVVLGPVLDDHVIRNDARTKVQALVTETEQMAGAIHALVDWKL